MKGTPRSRLQRGLLVFLVLALPPACGVEDDIRNWGARNRLQREKNLTAGELDKWERDLNLSRAKVKELHGEIEKMVNESRMQGHLAWKIGKAYCDAARYEKASPYFQDAVRRASANPPQSQSGSSGPLNLFEKSLPYYREALRNHEVETNLLFDAGLCYANASKVLGWERDRWNTAVFLFETILKTDAEDARAPYQLALLLGKVSDPSLRNVERAVQLLTGILQKDEFNVAARFALANILTEQGKFENAREEYINIMDALKKLRDKGVIPEDLDKSRQYANAKKNLETLEACISAPTSRSIGRPGDNQR